VSEVEEGISSVLLRERERERERERNENEANSHNNVFSYYLSY
jgi:hypothetical protein